MKSKLIDKFQANLDKLIKEYDKIKVNEEQLNELTSPKIEQLKATLQGILDIQNLESLNISYSHSIIGDPFNTSLDVKRRQIFFNTDIDDGGAVTFLKYIKAIFNYGGEEDEISIYINSPGGDVYAIFGIVDIIKNLPCKVNTYCYGIAASAALVLFVSGTGKRVISKNSFLMYHNAHISWLSGDHKDIKNQSIVLDNIQKILESIVIDSTSDKDKYGSQFWKDKGDHDWYINSSEALTMGLATEVE